jgi:hypothetical protein
MDYDDFQPRSAECGVCGRIFLKNEIGERYCHGCVKTQRLKKCGTGVCGKCGNEFPRKVMRQRFCSEDCRLVVKIKRKSPALHQPFQ